MTDLKLLVKNDVVADWVSWEQALQNKNLYSEAMQSSFLVPGLPLEYAPESGNIFRLPYVLLPEAEFRDFLVFTDELSTEILNELTQVRSSERFIRFFVHPTSVDLIRKRLTSGLEFVEAQDSKFLATPTSSTRSLVVSRSDPNAPVFSVKVSVFFVINNLYRHLDFEGVCIEIRRRQITRHLSLDDGLKSRLHFFREVAAIGLPLSSSIKLEDASRLGPGQPAEVEVLGTLIREIPEGLRREKIRLMPCTAFMSPLRKPYSWAEELAKKRSVNAVSFVREVHINSLVWVCSELLRTQGVSLEPHAQNVLLEFNLDFSATGSVWSRDLGSVWLDPMHSFFFKPDNYRIYLDAHNGNHMNLFLVKRAIREIVVAFSGHLLMGNIAPVLRLLKSRGVMTDQHVVEVIDEFSCMMALVLARHFSLDTFPSIGAEGDNERLIQSILPIPVSRYRDHLTELTPASAVDAGLPTTLDLDKLDLLGGVELDVFDQNHPCIWYAGANGFALSQKDHLVRLLFRGR